jgi:HK97 family phage major capsid protein
VPQLRAEDIGAWPQSRLQAELDRRHDRVAAIREGAGGSIENVTDSGELEEIRNLMADTNMLGERMEELGSLAALEQQFAARPTRTLPEGVRPFDIAPNGNGDSPPAANGSAAEGPRDLGGRFLASEAWRSRGTTTSFPLDSLFSGYRGIGEVLSPRAATFTTGDYPSISQFRPTPVEELFQANNIGPLLAQGSTDAMTVRYVVETITTTGAATVAEGAAKPEAALDFSPVDEQIRKIAVWLPLTDEALADEAFLRAYINARLRLFVQNEEDRQILLGDGLGTNLTGLMNRSGIDASTSYSLAGTSPGAPQRLIDAIFSAAMRVRESFLVPDNVVMRSSTWEVIRLAKDANFQYLMGPPAGDVATRIWGLPVTLNENMPAILATNEPVLVGAFRTAAMLVRRSGIDLAVSDSHASFFIENKVAIRAEERVGLLCFRPAGFATVTSAT